MKRYALLILIAAAGCSPNYTSGKTQCSVDKQCPSGYSCKDDGTSNTHYCFENKTLGCPSSSGFYCQQSQTCWPKPGACSTYTVCPAGSRHPGGVLCNTASYHADCNADQCVANGATPDAGPGGSGGIIGVGGTTSSTGKGGTIGTTITGSGGVIATGGITGKGGTTGTIIAGSGGVIGTGGNKDASPDVIGGTIGTGGIRDAGPDGIIPIGGIGGIIVTGGSAGRGGATGTGGIIGTGGTTTGSTLCTGSPYACTVNVYQSDCTYQNGCIWTSAASTCSGTCSRRTSQSSCADDPGCTWNTSTLTCSGTPAGCCTGTASGCGTYASGTWCIYNGCTWSGTLTCNTTTMSSYCSGLITSSTPTCTVCDYTECCGQMTACMNDTTCWNNSTGPLYQVWMDCFVGCCASSCM